MKLDEKMNYAAKVIGECVVEVTKVCNKITETAQTKTQKENIGIKDIIVDVLTENEKPMTISEMLKDERLKEYSNQKISALCTQLVKDGVIVRVEDKKKTTFALA